ncbi:helix-turn-helix transcriptional regulator [Enterococcus sp. BWB1-3]|uniref:helix-turn-helix domain-containing protein n=1 Tax=Enterococcus sp. BWB1-3 TaxID=2787713 RepID=UPI0019213EC8|nr:helix-turn-helix transcriptional regulator [Enterococcus sp. BWB1-3]MBL1231065.1 helix-turn-helix transcriptional regulator [Enterococcus sp. BWB1-3]
MNPEFQTFAENFKLLRKKRGLTQSQLAEKIGLTKQSIVNYEKGNTFPTGNRLSKISEVLETPVEQLIGSENIQSRSELELLNSVQSKASFLAHYDIMTEHFTDEIFKFFIEQLSTFSESELKQAILYLYDKRIQKEVDFYANDLAENIIRTTENQNQSNLDMDIVINPPTE